jgi:hypothetical protein
MEHLRLKAVVRANALISDSTASEADLQLAEDGVAAPTYTTAMVSNTMNAVVTFVSPHKVLEKQKRYMQCHCRKPKEIKTRVFVNHLMRINYQEIVHLPPCFNLAQSLPEDELVGIVVNSIPQK